MYKKITLSLAFIVTIALGIFYSPSLMKDTEDLKNLSIEQIQSLADKGSPDTQYKLGKKYASGKGVKKILNVPSIVLRKRHIKV